MKVTVDKLKEQRVNDFYSEFRQHVDRAVEKISIRAFLEAREKEQNHGVEMTVHLCVQRLFGSRMGRLAAKKLAKRLVKTWFQTRAEDRELLQLRGRLRQLWNNEKWKCRPLRVVTDMRKNGAFAYEITARAPFDHVPSENKNAPTYPVWLKKYRRYTRFTLEKIKFRIDNEKTNEEVARDPISNTYKLLIKFNLICLFSLMKQNQSSANQKSSKILA